MAEGAASDEQLRKEAVKRLKRKRNFWNSLITYAIINAFLVGIWAIGGTDTFFWPVFVLAGWGLALAFQAKAAFGQPHSLNEDRIQREMESMRKD